MILGVVIHAANIYSVNGNWLVLDPENSIFFNYLVSAIHAFRMPAFFWISGYFCALTFQKGNLSALIYKRIPRIAIPLISTWVTANLLQEFLLFGWHDGFFESIFNTGVRVFHLWFLVDLLIYTFIAAFFLKSIKHRIVSWQSIECVSLPIVLVLLAVFSLFFDLLGRSTSISYDNPYGFTSLFRLANYAPYFFGGVIMYIIPNLRKCFVRTPFILFVFAVPIAVFLKKYDGLDGVVQIGGGGGIHHLMIWVCIGGVLNAFYSTFSKKSGVTKFLSEVSYSVFLFHHVVVFMLGSLFLTLAMGPWMKFIFVSVISLVLVSALHFFVIKPIPVFRYLFNGK